MDAWEHYSHEADIGVRGTGPDVGTAFRNAAIALTAIVSNPEAIEPTESFNLSCESDDLEILFVDWLNEIIFLMSTRKMLFARFDLTIDNHSLKATIFGENINLEKHQPVVEPKGATFTTLCVKQTDDGNWIAQTVIDV